MKAFNAFRIYSDKDGHRAGLERLSVEDLPPGDVVIEARYSGINDKDALAGTGRGRILRRSPLIGGVDVAGIVVEISDDRFSNGDAVLVTGCGLGESHDGGYVVTGATGGVGSFAIQMFSQLGYEVVVVSGRSALGRRGGQRRRENPLVTDSHHETLGKYRQHRAGGRSRARNHRHAFHLERRLATRHLLGKLPGPVATRLMETHRVRPKTAAS